MVFHLLGEGFQRVSLSPSDSGHDPGDMEPCAEPLPMEIDEMSPGNVPCGGRFPVDTPITPPAIGLTHMQFCDKINGVPLPGDGPGRECFDTFPTFVVGAYSEHFGASDHGYSHWLGLTLALGAYNLRQFLFLLPEAAASAKGESFKNRLVHAFGGSGWVHDRMGEVVSRSVTSCAGMTAKVTIIQG